MDYEKSVGPACPIARAAACVGDAWSILILREASRSVRRFDDFRKNLGIAPTMLTKRLGALVEEGLLERRRYSRRPPRDEYVLTAAGRDFLPVLVMLGAWGRKHRSGGRLQRFIDVESGLDVEPQVVDAVTGARIGTRPVKLVDPDWRP